jgi:hypothetical protein
MGAYEGYARAGDALCCATMMMLSMSSFGGGKAGLTVWRLVGRFKSGSCPPTNLSCLPQVAAIPDWLAG